MGSFTIMILLLRVLYWVPLFSETPMKGSRVVRQMQPARATLKLSLRMLFCCITMLSNAGEAGHSHVYILFLHV